MSERVEQQTFSEAFYDHHKRRTLAPCIGERVLGLATEGLDVRMYEELTSGIAEALTGRIVSEYALRVTDGEVISEGGEKLRSMMYRARNSAYQLANQDPRFDFFVQRTKHELEEVTDQVRLANPASSHNTIVTISHFNEELLGQPDVLGRAYQDPHARRAMLRVSHWDGSKLWILTRSLDNASLELLKGAARDSLGYTVQSENATDLLGERIALQVATLDDAKSVADMFTASFDHHLHKQNGLSWLQGRSQHEARDVHEFVLSHPDIAVQALRDTQRLASTEQTYASFKKAFNTNLYNYTALYTSLLRGGTHDKRDITGSAGGAGIDAAARGDSYVMCGVVLNSNDQQQVDSMGYASLMEYRNKSVTCPDCNEKVVPDESMLKKGFLHCPDCKLTVSVCGDKTAEARSITNSLRYRKVRRQLVDNINTATKAKTPKIDVKSQKLTWWLKTVPK